MVKYNNVHLNVREHPYKIKWRNMICSQVTMKKERKYLMFRLLNILNDTEYLIKFNISTLHRIFSFMIFWMLFVVERYIYINEVHESPLYNIYNLVF